MPGQCGRRRRRSLAPAGIRRYGRESVGLESALRAIT